MISFKDISVVVQGPITEFTAQTLLSVRKILPEAELILSTWNDADIEKLDYDILVLSNDPGGFEFCFDCKQLYNVNRLIVSTFEGIKKANRLYVLKIRSDMKMLGSDFLNYFGLFPNKTNYSFLNQKVLIGDVYTRSPHFTDIKNLFHIGDFFYFGEKEDLRNIFNINLATQEMASYFKSHKSPTQYNTKIFCKYFPEQFIWLSFLQKYITVDLAHPFDFNKTLIKLHDNILVSNTILINLHKAGFECLKHPFKSIQDNNLYTHTDYIFLYYKICTNKLDFLSFLYFYFKKSIFQLKWFYRKIKSIERLIRHAIKQKKETNLQ